MKYLLHHDYGNFGLFDTRDEAFDYAKTLNVPRNESLGFEIWPVNEPKWPDTEPLVHGLGISNGEFYTLCGLKNATGVLSATAFSEVTCQNCKTNWPKQTPLQQNDLLVHIRRGYENYTWCDQDISPNTKLVTLAHLDGVTCKICKYIASK